MFRRQSRPATVRYINPPREIVENTKLRRAWLERELKEQLSAGEDAKITGTGSYQCISIKIKKAVTTKQQLRGLCQACGGNWAIVGGAISHHGYEIPDYGWRTQSCYGARYAPLSVSCDRAIELRDRLAQRIEAVRHYRDALAEGAIATLTREILRPVGRRVERATEEIDKTHPLWDSVCRITLAKTGDELVRLTATHRIVVQRIADWHAGKFADTTRLETVTA